MRSYTGGAALIEAQGATIAELLADIERRHPGMRFRMIDEQDRIRPHMKLFAGSREVRDLSEPMAGDRVLHLICALSGG